MKKNADRKFRGAEKGLVPVKGAKPMPLMKRMAGSSPSTAAESASPMPPAVMPGMKKGGVTGAKKYASGGSMRGYGISKKIKPTGTMC